MLPDCVQFPLNSLYLICTLRPQKVASSRPYTAVRTANPLSASNWGGGVAELLNQQQSRPATARILCNVLTRLQAAAAAAAASDLLGNELSISRRSLEMYRPTRKSCYSAISFFFVPIFYRSSSLSAHSAAWRGCAEYVGCLLSLVFLPPPPTFLRVGPSLRPPPHYQRGGSDAEEPPADTHNTDGMKCSAVISLSPSLSFSLHALYCDFVFPFLPINY